MSVKVSMYLDSRRAKEDGVYPLKIKVYETVKRNRKYYPTIFDFTKEEYENIWLSKKPNRAFKKLHADIKSIEDHAQTIADQLEPFDYSQFETLLNKEKGSIKRVKHYYEEKIKELSELDRIGTKATYEYSLKSVSDFLSSKGKNIKQLQFTEITKYWLEQYQAFMEQNGKSKTTIGIYLRPLRAVFNRAIIAKDITQDHYPFGGKKYQIPSGTNTKRPLSKEQLSVLFNSKPETYEQKKALDFWFFSYGCNGMNMKDIALLRFKDLKSEYFSFFRAKTKNSSTSGKPITIYLNSFTKSIIEEYGNKSDRSGYIFPIITKGMSSID